MRYTPPRGLNKYFMFRFSLNFVHLYTHQAQKGRGNLNKVGLGGHYWILHQAQKGLGNLNKVGLEGYYLIRSSGFTSSSTGGARKLNKVGLGGYYWIRVYSIKHGMG